MCSTTLGSGPRSDSATTPAIPNTGADSPLTRGTVPSRKKVLRVHRIAASTERERSDVRARPDRHVATDRGAGFKAQGRRGRRGDAGARQARAAGDGKSTRLNSSHSQISYAAFCLKTTNAVEPPQLHHHAR